ncbi:MAG: M36 family metallopeptidase [Bacteroidota bacterium]
MIKNFTTHWFLLLLLLCGSSTLWSQSQTALDIALRHIEDNRISWNLTEADIADLAITDMYTDKHSGKTRVYLIQRHNGIELQGGLINVGITADGKATNIGHRLLPNLAAKVNAEQAAIGPEQALAVAATSMEIALPRQLQKPHQTGEYAYRFEKEGISKRNIDTKLHYILDKKGRVHLVWNVNLMKADSDQHMHIKVDAVSGEVFSSQDIVLHSAHSHDTSCEAPQQQKTFPKSVEVKEGMEKLNAAATMGGSYRVYGLPTESPLYGDRTLEIDPADPDASPYGWHDIDGADGHEFTITRGNNTFSFLNRQNRDIPDSIDTNNDGNFDAVFEVDGGQELLFDTPINLDGSIDDYDAAAVVNLFYTVNQLHDIAYSYGFDEPAGNFQQNNYGKGGIGADPIFAQAQSQFNQGTRNNANFEPTPEGFAPRINMFLWDRNGGTPRLVNVTAPDAVAGRYNVSPAAEWGAQISATNTFSGEAVIAVDNNPGPSFTDGCETIVNADELDGKIAIIDRGVCQFGLKALNAEQAGAIGVIICNFEETTFGMAPGLVGAQVTIPVVMMSSSDCAVLREFAGEGLTVTMEPPPTTGPEFIDGDFDNGIIAHEYAHGISIRLVGGPSDISCLRNGTADVDGEQMGEGWSDFFSLITTVNPGEDGTESRGIGNYVLRQEQEGRGIRTFPYSTDMSINPDTYGDINQRSVPHGVGSIWCSMIWDMYWAFSEQYGWNADRNDKTAGNNMAVQLVMDGMKNLPCLPGFVDGRDAILMADQELFNGANQCMIWEVFARRGLGYLADQGNTFSSADGREDFNPLPTCVKELKIAKAMTPKIQAGDAITVTITVTNHTDETATNVVVSDIIPEHTTFVGGSVTGGYTASEAGDMLSIELPDMPSQQELSFSYQVMSSANRPSYEIFYDPAEENPGTWFPRPIGEAGNLPTNVWSISSDEVFEGSSAWHVDGLPMESIQHLIYLDPITLQGRTPVLRFVHKYDTEPGFDGGLVQLTTDDDPIDGSLYQNLDERVFRGHYDGPIDYDAFAIPNLFTFWGETDDWVETFIDLSDFRNEEIYFRFNFGTDMDDDPSAVYNGWTVDDIEFMDMTNYTSEACVNADNAGENCAMPNGRGSIVESVIGTSTNDPLQSAVRLNIFPNPVEDLLNINIINDRSESATMSLVTIDGREVNSQVLNTATTMQTLTMDVSNIPAGFYFIKVTSAQGNVVEKIIIR